jgi:hypothetical protein
MPYCRWRSIVPAMKSLAWLAMLFAPVAVAQQALGLGDMRLAVLEDPVRIEYQQGVEPSAERLRQAVAIIAAARGWAVASEKDQRWVLTRAVRGKHTVKIDLTCETRGCILSYVDSEDLLYEERVFAGTKLRIIHRNYNNWIRDLAGSLNGGLGVPAQVIYGFASLSAVNAVPFVDDAGRRGYEEFLGAAKPRAFAIGPNGAWGSSNQGAMGAGGVPTSFFNANQQDPLRIAVGRCSERGGDQCRLYAIDDRIVWTGAAAPQAAARAAPPACAADAAAAAPRANPAAGQLPAAGDCWVYRFVNRKNRGPQAERTFVVAVARASAAEIVDSASLGSGALRETQHTRGPYLVAQGAPVFSPYLAAFQDLPTGSLSGVKVIDPDACKPPYGCEVRARVVGRETVRLPAGNFDAIKVVVQHNWYPLSIQPGASSQNNELWGGRTLTIWYAPEAKRAVKFSSKLDNGLSPPVESEFDVELVSYRLN